jgi:hypothetical protein
MDAWSAIDADAADPDDEDYIEAMLLSASAGELSADEHAQLLRLAWQCGSSAALAPWYSQGIQSPTGWPRGKGRQEGKGGFFVPAWLPRGSRVGWDHPGGCLAEQAWSYLPTSPLRGPARGKDHLSLAFSSSTKTVGCLYHA